jgi:DNA-directed RNA polymerase subunit RPC12/RpoP
MHRAAEQREHTHATSQIGQTREPEYICEICGTRTDSWWHHIGETGTCRCRNCRDQGRTEPDQQRSGVQSTPYQPSPKPCESVKSVSQRLLWEP